MKSCHVSSAETASPPKCITCSDEAIPARVLELLPGEFGEMGRVETPDGTCIVSLALVDAVPGDSVLIHADVAIAKLAEGKLIEGSKSNAR